MRYERQRLMPQIGQKGQEKLKQSTVTVIGSGGRGCSVLTYLTCAGVGAIRIIDCDIVSETNLNRQFLHGMEDLGKLKVLSARQKLSQLNPNVKLSTVNKRVEPDTVEKLIAGSDAVVDCVDNMDTRVTVARACLRLDIPLVEGGACGFGGYVTDIGREFPCLSCLGYDKERPETPVPVLGVTAGIIGCIQANECLKLLLGIGELLYGRILNYDGLSGKWEELRVKKNEDCPVHGNLKG